MGNNTGLYLAQNCLDRPGIRSTGFRITEGPLYFGRNSLHLLDSPSKRNHFYTTTILNGCGIPYSYSSFYLKTSSSELPLITQFILL